jgi:hypothetical protein
VQYALSRYCTLRFLRRLRALPSVNAVGRRLNICAPGLIPGGAGLLDIMGASFAATGRGWRHLNVHVQAAGVLEGEEMAQDPGGPCVGYRRAASNGADREAGLKAPDPASPDTRQGGLPRAGGLPARLPKIAEARVPKGNA